LAAQAAASVSNRAPELTNWANPAGDWGIGLGEFGGKAMESRWGAGVEGKEQKGRDGVACVSVEMIDGDP